MASRRLLKAAQAIREVVSLAILTDIKDPRVENSAVTVTYVEVSGDMRQAKVYVSVMLEDEKKQSLCINGLQSSAGYLQQRIGKRLDTRYTPRLQFVLDQGVKNASSVVQVLKEVLPEAKGEAQAEQPSVEESSAEREAQ